MEDEDLTDTDPSWSSVMLTRRALEEEEMLFVKPRAVIVWGKVGADDS